MGLSRSIFLVGSHMTAVGVFAGYCIVLGFALQSGSGLAVALAGCLGAGIAVAWLRDPTEPVVAAAPAAARVVGLPSDAQRRAALEVFDRLDPDRAASIRRVDPPPPPRAPEQPCACACDTDRVEVQTFGERLAVRVICLRCNRSVGSEADWNRWKDHLTTIGGAPRRLAALLDEIGHLTWDETGWSDTDTGRLRRLLAEGEVLSRLARVEAGLTAPLDDLRAVLEYEDAARIGRSDRLLAQKARLAAEERAGWRPVDYDD